MKNTSDKYSLPRVSKRETEIFALEGNQPSSPQKQTTVSPCHKLPAVSEAKSIFKIDRFQKSGSHRYGLLSMLLWLAGYYTSAIA